LKLGQFFGHFLLEPVSEMLFILLVADRSPVSYWENNRFSALSSEAE